MKRVFELIGVMLLAAGLALAQTTALPEPPDPPDPSEPAAAASMPGQFRTGGAGVPMGGERVVIRAPRMTVTRVPGGGKWWKDAELAQKLGLTDDQIAQMEKIFQDHRLQLIDLHATLEKQEVLLEPMINADHPDEQQTLAQIDKVAQARANLEKSNARMLFAIRNVLTPEQWKKLQTERAKHRTRRTNVFYRRMPAPEGSPQPILPAPPEASPEPNPQN